MLGLERLGIARLWVPMIRWRVPVVVRATRHFEVGESGLRPSCWLVCRLGSGRAAERNGGQRLVRTPATRNVGRRPQGYGASMAVRCFLVDDNRGFLDAVQRLLDGDGIQVVGTASTTREALERVHRLRPDIALVDMVLGDESGFDLAHGLTEAPSLEGLAVILISTYAERDFADHIAAS
jgi:CheY-like chemotaxis protein